MTSNTDEPTEPGVRLRVLLVEWNEDGTVGGSHQVLYDLACGLDRTRFEPVALFYEANRFCQMLEARGVAVHLYHRVREHERRVRAHGGRLQKYADFLKAVLRRAKLLRELRVDVVHLVNSPWRGADDWLPACRMRGIPCVATAGGVLPGRLGPVERILVRRFDRVLAVSRSLAEGLRRFDVVSNVQVVHPGLDAAAFREGIERSREEIRAELGVPLDRILVTMVGNIRPWKGQLVALEAMARLPAEVRCRFSLVLVGGTSERNSDYIQRILRMSERPELAPYVRFLGERFDVADLFNASDLALHASLSPEPFGLVLVEALAVGTPVVASNRGGPTEILTPECGFLFDPDDPGELAALLERLSGQPDQISLMAEPARARAELFSVERMTREVEATYESVLGTKATGRSAA